MKTYFIKDIFESRRGIGIELMSDDISEENIIFYVSAATLKKMGLSKGMDIDEIVYSEIEDAHKLRVAVYKAADLLAAGDYSVARLQKKRLSICKIADISARLSRRLIWRDTWPKQNCAAKNVFMLSLSKKDTENLPLNTLLNPFPTKNFTTFSHNI